MGKYKSIELFAGAGGLALGLEQAGFEHIGLIEIDKDASETLKFNRKSWNVICEDVEVIAKKDLEKEFNIKKYELDLLSGGAPCQSFSYAGKRLGLEDTRGTMFYHYATFLKKLQPKMFLFENVKGLLSHDKGRTFDTICNIFEEENYSLNYKVLNAWDYGVAQKRERLIIIGIRKDLRDLYNFEFPKRHSYKPVLRDVLKDVPESEYSPYSGATKLPPSLNILHTQTQQIVPHACQQTVCQLPTIYTIAIKVPQFCNAHFTILHHTFYNSATHKPQTYGQIHRARLSSVNVSWLNIHLLCLH